MAISGATGNSYTIPVIKMADAGVYHCKIWTDCNTVSSTTTILTVDKAPQVITFGTLPEKTYGDLHFLLLASVNSGQPITFESSNTNVATVSDNILTIQNAGIAYITASVAENDNYYAATSMQQQLTINKAPLTITAENKERKQGEENPPFTLLYSGFKNNENENVLDVLPTIYCEANKNSPVGLYDIVLSGGLDNNYNYNLVNGKLEILPNGGDGIVETGRAPSLQVYPNPAKNYLFIKSDYPVEKIEIYNQSGVCVLINDVVMEKLDISCLVNGVYLAKIYVDGVPVIKKIVVKK